MKKITAVLILVLVMTFCFTGCGGNGSSSSGLDSLTLESSMNVEYAKGFNVDFYEGGYADIKFSDGQEFLVVPEGAEVPKVSGITVLQRPLDKTYLAATASMSLISAIDAVDNVAFSSVEEDDWYVEDAVKAMKSGSMKFAGKYSLPDYELLVSENCSLAIESTMLTHSPDIGEKLEELNIPVMMDLASNEEGPLARLEWIKVYGVLFDKTDEAESFFDEQAERVKAIDDMEKTDLTVAFFSINSQGLAVVRKTTDYVTDMIEMAGGKYIFDELSDDNALSTVNMSMEEFYDTAVDADIIIYNSAIESELQSVNDLIELNKVFKDFKAVKDGNVWCTGKNMYQSTDAIADIVSDMHAIISGDAEGQNNLKYIHKLN